MGILQIKDANGQWQVVRDPDYNEMKKKIDDISDELADKQNTLTFDTTPEVGSKNPITSGGVYEALQNIGTGGGVSKTFELICSYELTSDATIKDKISLEYDENGKRFALSDFYVEIIGGFEEPTSADNKARTFYAYVFNNYTSSTSVVGLGNATVGLKNPDKATTEKDKLADTRGFYLVLQSLNDGSARLFSTYSASSKNLFSSQMNISKELYLAPNIKTKGYPIRKIVVYSGYPEGNQNWWTGTTFKLYGVRINEN